MSSGKLEIATFGAGCFWCVEAIFKELKGVRKVSSGYMGGHTQNPTYEDVCAGTTGHAEVIQIDFDPTEVSYAELLEVFFGTHDPTSLNKQGNDVGTQYRSAIFYHSETQKNLAEYAKLAAEESGDWKNKIVTQIEEAEEYFEAENYHQNYFKLNPNAGYCRIMIKPKVEKFRTIFKEKLKKGNN